MPKLILAVALMATTVPVAGRAATHTALPVLTASVPEHGGGCRKDSPRGQCCHAGSQPLHCH